MSILKIALLQIAPDKTLEENLEKGIECCKKAKEHGNRSHFIGEIRAISTQFHGSV